MTPYLPAEPRAFLLQTRSRPGAADCGDPAAFEITAAAGGVEAFEAPDSQSRHEEADAHYGRAERRATRGWPTWLASVVRLVATPGWRGCGSPAIMPQT